MTTVVLLRSQHLCLSSHFHLANRCDDVYLAVRVEGGTEHEKDRQVKADSYITLSQSRPEQDPSDLQEEIGVLKLKLRQAEETAQRVQREVRGAWGEWGARGAWGNGGVTGVFATDEHRLSV